MKKIIPILLVILLITLLAGVKEQPELLHKAMFYEKLKNNYVRCDLCPNYCVLKENEIGICGVRQNIGGELYTLVYNQPVAIHVDPIEKKPLYHFFPGTKILSIATVGCNLRCNFCQN